MMTFWTHYPREGGIIAAALTAFSVPGRPTLAPVLPPLDPQNDLAPSAPGGPAPAQVPGAVLVNVSLQTEPKE